MLGLARRLWVEFQPYMFSLSLASLQVLQLPLTVHVGLTGSSKLSAGLSAGVEVLDLLVQIVIPPST